MTIHDGSLRIFVIGGCLPQRVLRSRYVGLTPNHVGSVRAHFEVFAASILHPCHTKLLEVGGRKVKSEPARTCNRAVMSRGIKVW